MPWNLTPEIAYLIEARRLRLELETQDVIVDQDQAHELARASLGPPRRWVERVPSLSPELRQLLDQVAREREQGMAHDHDPAPEPSTTFRSEVLDPRARAGLEQGQGGSAARQQQETPDRNERFDEVAWYLKNAPDPDDSEWS